MTSKTDTKHGFTPAFFTNVQPFVANYIPAEIDYLDIQKNDEYNLEEQESLYAANRETIIENSIRILLINFFLSYVARAEYKKYNLQAYCSDVANLILERSFKKHKDKDFLKFILIQFFILPIFHKYEQLDETDKRNVIQYMNKDPPILTYGSLMFFDHYMYYWFPDASMILFEALYLLKKGIPAKNLQQHFLPSADPSLQKYMLSEITRDSIIRIMIIYDQNRAYVEDTDQKLEKISLKINNYILFYESKFGEFQSESENEVRFTLDTMTPERFPYTSAIIAQAKKAYNDFLIAEKLFAKEQTSKKPQKKTEKKTGKKSETKEEYIEPKTEKETRNVKPPIHSYPFSISPPDAIWSCFVPSKVPYNEKTSLVYNEAMMFFLESGKVGISIPDPELLPGIADPTSDLPTKRAAYGISLVIALNDILYNDFYREKISKLIPGNTTVLSKFEMQTNVFRLSGIGSCFVNAIARLYSSSEQTKSNDTDCVILINPDLDEETFHRVYNGILSIITGFVCPTQEPTANTVDIRTLKTKLSYVASPVNVSFFQNYGYFPRNRAERVHLDISLFKVHEYTLANTILDISIYLRKNRRLREVWNLFSIDTAEFHGTPFPNPVALLIEMLNASKLDLRTEAEGGKGASRLAKVAFLKKIIPKKDVELFLMKLQNAEMRESIQELYQLGGETKRNRRKQK